MEDNKKNLKEEEATKVSGGVKAESEKAPARSLRPGTRKDPDMEDLKKWIEEQNGSGGDLSDPFGFGGDSPLQ